MKVRSGRHGSKFWESMLAVIEDERLKRYPGLYLLISSAIKQIDYPDAFETALEVRLVEEKFNEWDSSWGLLFTEESGKRAQFVRQMLRRLVRTEKVPTESDQRELRASFLALEIALRVDTGVYAVEFAEIERNFRSYDSVPHPENIATE
ncbi:MAG TPA: hypothetical protein VE974_06970 [Thermoanaerobaculia bacterium]|nr:hypothetical protein [Thermoanaerobaculia bacterium]